ncbi:hypothetical protein Emed_007426 [Eimeria media]
MLEKDQAEGGLAASPFFHADPNPASSSPFRVVEEAPSEIHKRFAVGPRASLHRPAAAGRIFLVLLSSIGAAVAFLLATCFHRFRSRGAAEGLHGRSLAGQQHGGGPPEEGDDEDSFLFETLEGCLDLESELGLAAPTPQPLPPTENEAVTSIVSSLKEASLLFEVQQVSSGLLETSLSPLFEEGPSSIGLIAQEGDQWSGQGTGIWHEGGGPFGAPLAPGPEPLVPPHGSLEGIFTTPDLLFLQQLQGLPSSEAAAAADGEGASRPSFFSKEEETDPPPPKKARGHFGEAPSQSLLHTAILGKPQQTQPQQQYFRPSVAPAKTTPQGPPMQSDLLASSSGVVSSPSGAASAQMSLSMPQAPGPSGSPQPSTSWQSPESTAQSNAELLQPSATLQVAEGSITIVPATGEKITFPHPPLPTPPNTPRHYRLPLVPAEAVQTHFLTHAVLSGTCCRGIWDPLSVIRTRLRKRVLNSVEVTQVIAACQQVVKYLLRKHTNDLRFLNPSKATERLAMRYLCLEALVNCVQSIGPSMKPEEWFFHLVRAVPVHFRLTSVHRSSASRFNTKLLVLLQQALTELRAGRRPSLKLTKEIKKKLFCSKVSPSSLKQDFWDKWRSDFEEDKGR